MNRKTAAVGAIALAFASVALGRAIAQAPAPPVSFAAEQAQHGQQAYQGRCQACHGPTLAGGPGGPPLTGTAFRSRWRNQPGDALFNFIRQKMPPGAGGSLSDADTADLTAKILQANGVAAGAALPADAAKLAQLSLGRAFPPDPEVKAGHVAPPTPVPPDKTAIEASARLAERLKAITPVTDDMLRDPPAGEWLNWRNTYDAHGFSRLGQVSRDNVGRLQAAWSWELASSQNEITPLVHDGVIFLASGGRLQALDAATGDLLWQYARPGATGLLRNLAIYGDKIYFAAGVDMVAVDIHDGHLVWEKALASPSDGVLVTAGPLAAKGKIYQGMSYCHTPYPGGCFIVALDAATGHEVWRFHTLARPGQPGGDSWNGAPVDARVGGSVWTAGSYDPDLDLLFFGVGQTYHTAVLLQGGDGKPGSADGLYTDTTLALRPETGELVWYYQHFARDVWDLDWAYERTLATLQIDGKPRRTITTAGKLAIFDTLDAATGKYLFSKDVGLQGLVAAIDPKTGAKTVAAKFKPEANVEKLVCPSALGGRNWPATAYNPQTGVLFVPLNESCMKFEWTPGPTFDMVPYPVTPPGSDGMIGRVEAIDLATQKTLWVRRERAVHASSILATAGGLIFEGTRDRWFRASDDRTGKVLWQVRLNGSISSSPITYSVNGVQYVAVTTGGGAALDGMMGALTPEIRTPASGVTLWVFRLPPS
jgi:alcohol dehydrogenase (cytochrome c)